MKVKNAIMTGKATATCDEVESANAGRGTDNATIALVRFIFNGVEAKSGDANCLREKIGILSILVDSLKPNANEAPTSKNSTDFILLENAKIIDLFTHNADLIQ